MTWAHYQSFGLASWHKCELGGPDVAKYYYTTTPEDPAVYHTNQECSEGKKIEAKDRVDTDVLPTGRRKCEVC